MVQFSRRARRFVASLLSDRELAILSVLSIVAAIGIMVVGGDVFLGRVLVAQSDCGAEPSWPDCEVKSCSSGNWTCTQMKATSSWTSGSSYTSGSYSGGTSVESCKAGCDHMTSGDVAACKSGCDSMGTSGTYGSTYPSGSYNTSYTSGGGTTYTSTSGTSGTQDPYNNCVTGCGNDQSCVERWCASMKSSSSTSAASQASTMSTSGSDWCWFSATWKKLDGNQTGGSVACRADKTECHEYTETGRALTSADIVTFSSGPTGCYKPASGGNWSAMSSYPSGGMGSMKNCKYPNATKNGRSVIAVCEADYYKCKDNVTGAELTNEGLSLGAPSSCESGWSGGSTTMPGGTYTYWSQAKNKSFSVTSRADCDKYGNNGEFPMNEVSWCYQALGSYSGTSGGTYPSGGYNSGPVKCTYPNGVELTCMRGPHVDCYKEGRMLTSAEVGANGSTANCVPTSTGGGGNYGACPAGEELCSPACYNGICPTVMPYCVPSGTCNRGGTDGGYQMEECMIDTCNGNPACMAPAWTVKCNSEECRKYGSNCRPVGGVRGTSPGPAMDPSACVTNICQKNYPDYNGKDASAYRACKDRCWSNGGGWNQGQNFGQDFFQIYGPGGHEGDQGQGSGPSAQALADISAQAAQNCGFGWGRIDHETLDPLKDQCVADVKAYVSANPSNPEGAFEIGNYYHSTVYAQAQQKVFAKQMCGDVKKYGLSSLEEGIRMAPKFIAKMKAAGRDVSSMEGKLEETKQVRDKVAALLSANNCEEAQMLIGQWQMSMQQFESGRGGFDTHAIVAQQFSGQFEGTGISAEDLAEQGFDFEDFSDAATLIRNGGVTAAQLQENPELLNAVQVSNITGQDIGIVAQLTQQIEELKRMVADLTTQLSSLQRQFLQQITDQVAAGPKTTAYINAVMTNVDEKDLTPEKRAEIIAQVEDVAGEENQKLFNLPFNDFASVNKWNVAYIVQAQQHGIVEGNPDGSYRDDQPMNQVELGAVTARALGGIPEEYEDEKASDPAIAWFGPAEAFLRDEGVLSSLDIANPTKPVTRAQLAHELAYLLRQEDVEVDLSQAVQFPDTANLSPEAQADTELVSAAGLMTGQGDGTFDPEGIVNRGQVATVFVRLYDVTGQGETDASASAGIIIHDEEEDAGIIIHDEEEDAGIIIHDEEEQQKAAAPTVDLSYLENATAEQWTGVNSWVKFWNSQQKDRMSAEAVLGRKLQKALEAAYIAKVGLVQSTVGIHFNIENQLVGEQVELLGKIMIEKELGQ